MRAENKITISKNDSAPCSPSKKARKYSAPLPLHKTNIFFGISRPIAKENRPTIQENRSFHQFKTCASETTRAASCQLRKSSLFLSQNLHTLGTVMPEQLMDNQFAGFLDEVHKFQNKSRMKGSANKGSQNQTPCLGPQKKFYSDASDTNEIKSELFRIFKTECSSALPQSEQVEMELHSPSKFMKFLAEYKPNSFMVLSKPKQGVSPNMHRKNQKRLKKPMIESSYKQKMANYQHLFQDLKMKSF